MSTWPLVNKVKMAGFKINIFRSTYEAKDIAPLVNKVKMADIKVNIFRSTYKARGIVNKARYGQSATG